jgi:hypothetical protein
VHPLPVPESDASVATSRIDGAIELVEAAIGTRGAQASGLDSWVGRGRLAWDEQFAYSQGDLAVALDDLQLVRAEIGRRLHDLRHHNLVARVAAMGGLAPALLPAPAAGGWP